MCPRKSAGTNRGLEDHPQHSQFRGKTQVSHELNNVRNINTHPDTRRTNTQKCRNWKRTAFLSRLKRAACTTQQVARGYGTDAELGEEGAATCNCNSEMPVRSSPVRAAELILLLSIKNFLQLKLLFFLSPTHHGRSSRQGEEGPEPSLRPLTLVLHNRGQSTLIHSWRGGKL